jgi:chemotaxis protein methyltransferase CheR
MDDDMFRHILGEFGLSWRGYRKVRKGVKKRLGRHMTQLGCRNVDDYLRKLAEEPELKKLAEQCLTVTISRFFRDRRVWRDLRDHVLPDVTERARPTVTIWSAGCACGEEAYSVAILWDMYCRNLKNPPALELVATDVNVKTMAKAKAGMYGVSSLKELEPEIRARYFQPSGGSGRFKIADSIRTQPRWRLLDLLVDEPPAQEIHIVFLRNNLLTYYRDSLQRTVLRRVVDSLAEDGYLIIRSHERIPARVDGLTTSDFNKSIVRKSVG